MHDSAETLNLLRLEDTVVYRDSGYLKVEKQKEVREDERLAKIVDSQQGGAFTFDRQTRLWLPQGGVSWFD
ncbi:MAG: hypothetical protein Q4D98_01335 [Planctomycetia bacterium]|nr:hypothetical protein [Planctomycetia bacterium]